MRKLFFIVFCILAFDICLAEGEKWWEENFIVGAHWGPPLHHKYNNVDSPLVRNFTLLKEGGFNFIVGQMNPHNSQAKDYLTDNMSALITECSEIEKLYFLVEKNETDTIYGVDIKDEPKIEEATGLLDKVKTLKQRNPEWLGFINLYPSHAECFHGHFNEWEEYVDSFLSNGILQVACFDNYFPNSNFNTHRPENFRNYYANLAYMKNLAGSRPLWAYLRCSEKYVEEKDSAWQDAYMRIGAFAPLAFGAKGILYFSYDCKDRNKILRSPGRGGWRPLYFDNDEKDRQIFFGNFKYSSSNYPDLAIHTNDSLGTWYIKETIEGDNTQNLVKIGTWFGDHINHIPNIYNWDFNPNGRDKFTTITRDGRLLLSRFRSGWTHKAIIDVPWSLWSTMSRYTCPFGDFNENHKLDLCLGWTENGQGKLRIYMDCQENAIQDPSTSLTDMSFDNSSQVFTFSTPIKQVIARNDSIWVITPNSLGNGLSDCLYILTYWNNQFSIASTHGITLPNNEIDHYWMEDGLYAQDVSGSVWGEATGQEFHLTNRIDDFSDVTIYVWGQYNPKTNKYDRYAIAPDWRDGFQSYALLDRKGNPNRIYYTAKTINQFVNDSISNIIKEGIWQGAYFTSKPNQTALDTSIVIKINGNDPIPLISKGFAMSNAVMFGLFKEKNSENLNLLVINMREFSRDIIFTINQNYNNKHYLYEKTTRMHPASNNPADVYGHYTTIELKNMYGGECAILHLTKTSSP